MILIVCVDEQFGMGFNHRRQSSDRVVTDKIIKLSEDSRLWMDPYSAFLFPESASICCDKDFIKKASFGDFCFVETADIGQDISRAEKIILFQWNRRYPADLYFPQTVMEDCWKMIHMTDFVGSSHERITMKVFER